MKSRTVTSLRRGVEAAMVAGVPQFLLPHREQRRGPRRGAGV